MTRLDLSGETIKGDPAVVLLGHDEKPARIHGKQPPAPPAVTLTFIARLERDVRLRLEEVERQRAALDFEAKGLRLALRALRGRGRR